LPNRSVLFSCLSAYIVTSINITIFVKKIRFRLGQRQGRGWHPETKIFWTGVGAGTNKTIPSSSTIKPFDWWKTDFGIELLIFFGHPKSTFIQETQITIIYEVQSAFLSEVISFDRSSGALLPECLHNKTASTNISLWIALLLWKKICLIESTFLSY